MKNAVGDLTKSLNSYNPTVNEIINGINKSFQAVGILIITMLMAVEMLSWYRYLKDQNGGISIQLFVEISMKYVIAYFLVLYSGILAKEFLWLCNKFADLIGANNFKEIETFAVVKKGNFFIKAAVNVIAWISGSVAMLSLKIVTFLRFIELYLLKAIAPILIAFWMADSTRSIAVNFFKRLMAISFQSVIIIIILSIWQGFKIDTALKMSNDGIWGNFADGTLYIGKCIVFTILIIGSQRTAKSLLQAN
ncbi:type IV secretion system protein [Streptococcus mutans]|uniref:type IV secretion system protein n=1 Tax=Streptococcus mutans TaxID=1309 RepID=UPI0002BF7A96|nr:type IV secretion system protein [Streptococcus mutans]EMP57566.1 hypothetical protein D816_09845 [Streptococcus mutans 5DC8]MCB4971325.1 type IV secretion system protein [Streptococcus mutans]MCB4973396.1 type IV secretion system protein [Streptococcus mutans]MCB5055544.1 type IV secretion system protein [Streptococcus mutans]